MAFKRSILDYAIPFPDNIPMHDQWIGLLSERVGKVESVTNSFFYIEDIQIMHQNDSFTFG